VTEAGTRKAVVVTPVRVFVGVPAVEIGNLT